MSIQKVMSSSHTGASYNRLEYDVFLSFRGEDTRKNFTGHLYTALNQKGIKVFKDDKELERGKVISPELIKAIEKSRFSLIVLSRNYASSTWCLEELVKIIECKNIRGQTVIPIFYDVDPSTVRKQRGSFEEAFINHELTENRERVQKWKSALKDVANLSGWDANDRDESELIQEIVKNIIWKLNISKCMNIKDLVGIESHLEKLKMLIGVGSNDTRVIGIWGMGGIGKTTIARVVYELICDEFEGCSFLANVRENSNKYGIVSLQKQLLSQILKGLDFNIYNEYDGRSMIKGRLQCKKVLIVLDDVDHELQLNELAKRDWVGSGSRIIITTRDQRLLTMYGVDKTYNIKGLNDYDGVRLFSLKAFKSHQPSKDYEELSTQVVKYASGIPLALKVLGSFLFDRSVDEWEDSIKRLHKIPNKEIFDILQISFDGLEEFEKEIFLDLACFFKRYKKDYVIGVLHDFNPIIGIRVLVDKSLITISNDFENRIEMHDLLQAMGQRIAKRESIQSGKNMRLWEKEDACHMLKRKKGMERVGGIVIEEDLNISVSAKAFSKMINLRLLKVRNVQLVGELECLSEKLRLLEWHGYPLRSLPSSLQWDKIVGLITHSSPIKQLPRETRPLMLTKLCLVDCPSLKEVPDLTCTSNLDELTLEGCLRLRRIRSNHLILKKLRYLKVRNCANLRTLPCKISMDSLLNFMIGNCPKLEKFPDIIGKMEHLRWLYISTTAIKDMPSSVGLLTGLKHLFLSDNENFVTLPDSINGLKSLQTFKLTGCSSLQNLPTTINGLNSLRTLRLFGCSSLQSLPTSINGLECLDCLDLSGCSSLQSLPATINGLKSLRSFDLSYCSSLQSFPTTINGLKCLDFLDLSGCSSLQSLPTTINGLNSLRTFRLYGCSSLQSLPTAINGLTSLHTFKLSGCSKLDNVADTLDQVENSDKNLEMLSFRGSKGQPSESSFFRQLHASWHKESSDVMTVMAPSLEHLFDLKTLDLSDCDLREEAIPDVFFSCLVSLEVLNLSRNDFVSLPQSIDCLPKLQYLSLEKCKRLRSVPELPSSMRWVNVNDCASLETLSDAFKANRSRSLEIYCLKCWKLSSDGSGSGRLMFPMLKDFLKEPITRRSFSIVGPGSEIPEWVRYQSMGSQVNIDRPQDLYDNKLVGFVVCSQFDVFEHLTVRRHLVFCRVQVDNRITRDYEIDFEEKLGHSISEQLWLMYLSHENWEKEYNKIEFSYAPIFTSNDQVVVRRCGVHPIYEKDVQDLNQIMNQSSSSTSSQDFIGSTNGVGPTRRNLPKYDYEEPEPKRLKCSNDDL